MKSTVLRVLPLFLLLQFSAKAQQQQRLPKKNDPLSSEVAYMPGENVQCVYIENQLVVSRLKPDDFDKAELYNMQGAAVLRQKINAPTIRIDATGLVEGVYLLVLRSSVSLREKSMKIVVRR